MDEVVFIAHRLPFPPNKGEKLRAYHFLKFISNRYPTHLICHVDEERDLDFLSQIDLPLASFHYCYSPRRNRKLRCLKALFVGSSLTVSYFYDRSLQSVFDELLHKKAIRYVFCSCAPSAEYVFRANYSGYKIIDLMDVDSEKWHDYAKHFSFPMRAIYSEESRRLRKYERKIAQRFDRILLVTDAEVKLFRERVYDSDAISVVENGVDLLKFSPSYRTSLSKKGPVLVFTGVMDYWPNAEGVIWFSRKVLPLIQKEVPDLRFFIVGKDPLPEVKDLSKNPNVLVTGYVDDVRDYIALADVSVVPLRIARGVQNKVLESMAMAKPVVATSKAVEGIKGVPGRHFLVADTPADFADSILRLLQDKNLSETLGHEARNLVENYYSWEKRWLELERILP